MHKAGQISQTTIEIIIVIGIVILLNVLGQFFYSRIDLTDDQRYTLADSSKRVVANLEELLYIKVYLTTDLPPNFQPARDRLTDLLEEYTAAGSINLIVQYIDPEDMSDDERTALEMKGIVEQVYQTQDADAYGERRAYFDVELEYVQQSEVITVIPQRANLEYEITSAIIKLTSDEQPTVGFLTGHGELSREQDFQGLASAIAELIAIQDVDISNGQLINDNIDVLVIARPMNEFTEREKYIVDQFVMRGGRLVFMSTGIEIDQVSGAQAVHKQVPLDTLLAAYGVKINNDLVADPEYSYKVGMREQGQIFATPINHPLIPIIHGQLGGFPSGSPATRGVGALVFLYISSVDVLYDVVPEEMEVMELMKTSESSFQYPAPVNLDISQDFATLAGSDPTRQLVGVQLNGTFTSAFAGQPVPTFPADPANPDALPEMDTEPMLETSEPTSIVVIGSGDFIAEGHSRILYNHQRFNGFNASNEVFFFNLLESLSMGDALIDIRNRSTTPRPLNPELTSGEMNGMKFWAYAFIPLAIIILGIGRFYLKGQRKRMMAAYIKADDQEKAASASQDDTGNTGNDGGDDE